MIGLFVYGTLKRGCSNHEQMAGQTFVAEAHIVPGFRLFDVGGFPGLVVWPADRDGVTGELWSVDDDALQRLDRFEGIHEGLYRREPVALAAPHQNVRVFTYLFARSFSGLRAIDPTWTE